MSKEPKNFIVTRAKSEVNSSKIRDENISKVFDENIKRQYDFKMNPNLIADEPTILILPKFESDYYWRGILECLASFGFEIGNIVSEDSPKNTMCEEMKVTLCDMAKLMNTMVNSDSWKNDELSDSEKENFNKLIDKLKFD